MNERHAPATPARLPIPPWSRRVGIASAIALGISTAFPVGACVVKDSAALPRIWGILDVAIAAIVAVLTIAVVAIAEKRVDARANDAAYRVYRVLLNAILVGLVVFLTFGDRINWTSCLPGFAWRAWLLLYALPTWLLTVRRQSSAP